MKSEKTKGRLRKAFTREKIKVFLDKQGFYIVLFVCIMIIGVTAFITSGKDRKPQELADKGKTIEDDRPIEDQVPDVLKDPRNDRIRIRIDDSTAEEPKTKPEEVKETLGSGESKEKPAKENKAEPEKKKTNKKDTSKAQMIYPVQGNIIKGHSVDELVYSDTLKEWATHSGMDIESPVGSEVKAAMGGTIEEIVEDRLMGICISIDHGKGLKTFYANLSTGNMVTVDQKVDKGQIISGVGRTASSEILDSPHLHFEVKVDGKSVDPSGYLIK